MGGRHEKPGMLKTRIQLEVVQRYEDDERMPGHGDSRTVVDWNPNPVYCGRKAECGQLVEMHQSASQMIVHLLLRRVHG